MHKTNNHFIIYCLKRISIIYKFKNILFFTVPIYYYNLPTSVYSTNYTYKKTKKTKSNFIIIRYRYTNKIHCIKIYTQ